MRRRLTAAAVVMPAVLSACAIVMPAPDEAIAIEELDVEARPGEIEHAAEPPTGPVVEVARGRVAGERFSLTVHASRHGACTWMEREGSGGGACGSLRGEGVPDSWPFGMVAGGGGGGGAPAAWSGLVPPDVASVLAETTSAPAGAVLVSLEPAGIDGQLFVVFVPGEADVRGLVALAEDGSVSGRFEVGIPPRNDGDGGPVPTPAAATPEAP